MGQRGKNVCGSCGNEKIRIPQGPYRLVYRCYCREWREAKKILERGRRRY